MLPSAAYSNDKQNRGWLGPTAREELKRSVGPGSVTEFVYLFVLTSMYQLYCVQDTVLST